MMAKPISRLFALSARNPLRTRIYQLQPRYVVQASASRPPAGTQIFGPAVVVAPVRRAGGSMRDFHSSKSYNGLMPDAENPAPKESEANERVTVPTDISTAEYNKRADEWLEELINKLEQEQEKRQDVEVEYSAGVLEVSIASKGTYVLNKQPPNKQIWLSSPESGPKRFDWVVTGESMNQKEGGGVGDWIYLRDGTSLTELVRKEMGVEIHMDSSMQ